MQVRYIITNVTKAEESERENRDLSGGGRRGASCHTSTISFRMRLKTLKK